MDMKVVALFLTLILVGAASGGRDKYFDYTVTNVLLEPHFNESINLKLEGRQNNLIYYMQKACLQDPDRFTNFTATFKPKIFSGYFIDAINGAYGNWPVNQTYWRIDNADGPLTLGVSKYLPVPNDKIVFNLIRYTGTHP